MRVNVNIEITDDVTTEDKLNEIGITAKFIEVGYKMLFDNMLKDICTSNGCEYNIDVSVN